MDEILMSRGAYRRLLTLAKANEAWKIAAACWHRLRESGVSKDSPEYDVLAMPVVVLYCRPFTQCGGLSPLNEYADFSTAPNPTAFAANHDIMMAARHKVFAHLDVPGAQEIIEGRPEFDRTDFIAVRREPDGSFSFETKNLMPNLLNGLGVPMLLAFQLSRLGHDMVDETERLIGTRLPVGKAFRLIDRETRRERTEGSRPCAE